MKIDGEYENQNQPEPKIRNRDTEKRQTTYRLINPRMRSKRRNEAARDSYQDTKSYRDAPKSQGRPNVAEC